MSDAEDRAKLEQTAAEAAKYHRWFAVEANNTAWEFIDKADRTADETDRMIARAHAAWYHWSHAGDARNLAIADWLCSHVYAVLGRAEPAAFHAERCLTRCREHGLDDFPLAYAHEALARVALLTGDRATFAAELAAARAQPVADEEDRDILNGDLAALEALAH